MPIGKWIPSVEKLTRWADGVKSASITLIAAGAATITGVGVVNAVATDSVSVEPIKVPAPFVERGFTSEIATARLLDEITTFQRSSASEKERVSILDKSQGDELDKLQPSFGGVDVKRIQQAVQDSLGIKKQRITGEITFHKEGDDTVYHVRLRRLPANQVLSDLTVAGSPEQVLKKTAMAMIEVFDPHIAANIYWRDRDEDNALRMIDVVLNSDRKEDYKYSLNLRGNIHNSHKQFDESKKDFEQIMAIDPNFAAGHRMAAVRLLAQGQLDESLRESERSIELGPTKWYGYFQKAQVLRALKRDDEAESNFSRTIALKPPGPGPYLQAGQFMASRSKLGDAEATLRKGLANFPDSSVLYAGLGEVLQKKGQTDVALRAYRRAIELDPKNQIAIAAKGDLERAQTVSARRTND
jgi:tetratricopeptide (TPR) repeat protein